MELNFQHVQDIINLGQTCPVYWFGFAFSENVFDMCQGLVGCGGDEDGGRTGEPVVVGGTRGTDAVNYAANSHELSVRELDWIAITGDQAQPSGDLKSASNRGTKEIRHRYNLGKHQNWTVEIRASIFQEY